jgi:hypothetical protein
MPSCLAQPKSLTCAVVWEVLNDAQPISEIIYLHWINSLRGWSYSLLRTALVLRLYLMILSRVHKRFTFG